MLEKYMYINYKEYVNMESELKDLRNFIINLKLNKESLSLNILKDLDELNSKYYYWG